MSKACEAILERCTVSLNRASQLATQNGCPYCSARHSNPLTIGDKVAVLNGSNAGSRFLVEASPHQGEFLGVNLDNQTTPHERTRLGLPGVLYGKLPLEDPPSWLPALSLPDAFIIDELAVWLCGHALETGNFVWHDADFDECVRVMWEKRLPVTALELVAVFAAHGLPTTLHRRFASRFTNGIRLLCRVKGRSAIQKKRLRSFDDIDAAPKTWFDKYILPGLPSG